MESEIQPMTSDETKNVAPEEEHSTKVDEQKVYSSEEEVIANTPLLNLVLAYLKDKLPKSCKPFITKINDSGSGVLQNVTSLMCEKYEKDKKYMKHHIVNDTVFMHENCIALSPKNPEKKTGLIFFSAFYKSLNIHPEFQSPLSIKNKGVSDRIERMEPVPLTIETNDPETYKETGTWLPSTNTVKIDKEGKVILNKNKKKTIEIDINVKIDSKRYLTDSMTYTLLSFFKYDIVHNAEDASIVDYIVILEELDPKLRRENAAKIIEFILKVSSAQNQIFEHLDAIKEKYMKNEEDQDNINKPQQDGKSEDVSVDVSNLKLEEEPDVLSVTKKPRANKKKRHDTKPKTTMTTSLPSDDKIEIDKSQYEELKDEVD